MDQTQIDVKYNLLLKWLEERYLIPKDWAKRIEAINLKKGELLEQLYQKTTDEFKKIQDTFKTRREVFNFDDLNRLNQMLLKTEEAKSKGIFGGYNSKIINDCTLIISLYNKNNVFLCDLSKNIIQSIAYDIPDLDNQISSLEKNMNDNHGKIEDRKSQIERNNERIKGIEKTYEIKADQIISNQLIKKLERLPDLLTKIERKLRDPLMNQIIDSYQNYYQEIHASKTKKEFQFIDILKRFYKEGDYSINDKSISIDALVKSKIEAYSTNETGNWEIKLEGDKTSNNNQSNKNQEDCRTVLLDQFSREKLLNNLNELIVFVSHRLYLLTNKDEITLSINQQNLREVNKNLNQDFLINSKKYLQEILSNLDDSNLIFLINLFNDKKYVTQIQSNVENLRLDNEKLKKAIKEFETKNTEYKEEIAENKKKILNIKKESKLIKKQMEKKMTDLLKRKITIIGDLNLID